MPVVVFLFLASALCIGINPSGNPAYANSGPPNESQNSSGILFEQNQAVKIDSEVLDIVFGNTYADVTATYKMTNQTAERHEIESLFISAAAYGMDEDYIVKQDGAELRYVTEYYASSYYEMEKNAVADWERILAAEDGDYLPFGDGTGYKKYTEIDKYVTGGFFGFAPQSHYFIGGKAEAIPINDGLVEIKYIYGSYMITKENMDIPDGIDCSIIDIDNIYDYLYDRGMESLNMPEDKKLSERYYKSLFREYLKEILSSERDIMPTEEFLKGYGVSGSYVGTVGYKLTFEPHQTTTVSVSYKTMLGGRPGEYNDFWYYLSPAGYWADFKDITINVTTDGSLPKLESNLDFKKTGKNTYRFTCEELPDSELKLVAKPNLWGNIRNFFTNPYALIFIVLPVGALAFIIIIAVVIIVAAKRAAAKRAAAKRR